MVATRRQLLQTALWLAYFTVGWNVAEGVIAIGAAAFSGSRAILGFGLDSFVESLSGGVVIWRLKVERADPERADLVERRAVRLIGVTFFVLAAFVAFEAIRALVQVVKPAGSPVGIALTVVSLIVMPVLASRKRSVGRAMGSRTVTTDSSQTMACVYLSIVVLAGLLLNALFGWWWADPIAALVVVGLLLREGWEAVRAEHVDDCC